MWKFKIKDLTSAPYTRTGRDNFFNVRSMDVFISKLRKHLKKAPAVEILNIRGIESKLVS